MEKIQKTKNEINAKIKDIIRKFCQMMLDKEADVQSVKVKIGMKDKSEIKFKQFRKYGN